MEEKQLVRLAQQGSPAAYEELVTKYQPKVYSMALSFTRNREAADDLAQEVFLKVFRSFRTFKKGARLGSWLYRVTYNASIDHLRKKGAAPEPVEDDVLERLSGSGHGLHQSAPPDPAEAAETGQIQDRIARALETISPQERAVFVLRHYEDLMLKDIAESLGLSIGSVKSYLFRAVRKLQKELRRPALMSSHGDLR